MSKQSSGSDSRQRRDRSSGEFVKTRLVLDLAGKMDMGPFRATRRDDGRWIVSNEHSGPVAECFCEHIAVSITRGFERYNAMEMEAKTKAGTVSEKQETRRVKLRAEARKISQKLGETSVNIDSVKLAMVSLGYTKGDK